MEISVTTPLVQAIDRTKQVLFQPFRLGKWFLLGFCAWLAHLGEGGGPNIPSGDFGGGGPGPGPGGRPGARPEDELERMAREAVNWMQANLGLVIAVAVIILVLLVAITLTLSWVKCRFQFLLLDGVVREQPAVVEPWRVFAPQGNSLFLFQLAFGLANFLTVCLIIAAGIGIAWVDIQARSFGAAAILAILASIMLVILWAIIAGVVGLFLNDFVVPIMYLRRTRVLAAWGEFHRSLLSGQMGTFALYVLFRILIGIGTGMIAGIASCLTCCISCFPYLGDVVILPIHVFNRAYPLYFLQQFGPEWQFFGTPEPDLPPGLVPDHISSRGPSEWSDDRFRSRD